MRGSSIVRAAAAKGSHLARYPCTAIYRRFCLAHQTLLTHDNYQPKSLSRRASNQSDEKLITLQSTLK